METETYRENDGVTIFDVGGDHSRRLYAIRAFGESDPGVLVRRVTIDGLHVALDGRVSIERPVEVEIQTDHEELLDPVGNIVPDDPEEGDA